MLSRLFGNRSGATEQVTVESHPVESKPPIYLISMAGFPNYGDELIAQRWLAFLAKHQPEVDVWLDVREPGTVASLLKDIHPRLHVTNTLFRATHEYLHGLNRTPAELVRDLGSPKFDVGLLELREAGMIHLLGGGFVNSIWQENSLIVDAMRAVAEISGAQLVATGQGLMPLIGEDFSGFKHVSVRDTPSAQALRIPRGWDDAYLLDTPPALEQSSRVEDLELYLCVQNDALEDGAHGRMIDFARQQAERLGIPREKTFYVEAIPGDDYAGFDALRDLVADQGFIPFAHFWRSDFKFHSRQIWITSRFHHHLMGALHGARGIAISGNPGYYDVKHSSLADSGTHWKVFTGHETPWGLDELDTPDSFERQVSDKYAEARAIYGV